ncbi:MAG TPA: DUF3376 domain-containing protein [Gemmatimonadota bacterium]|nr:DUF3376 domain-containing protein [Gemmatimonadota bacterium]
MTKIALVLGGGVSLGSYIGGAVSELLHAFQNNSLRSDAGPVRVHVITGTSAGAINAALAARTLAVNADLLPWIERAWVEIAAAEHLLNPDRPDRRGWLDDSAMEDLSRALITADPASDDAFNRVAGDPLRVGLTLANLYGVRYDMPYGFLNVPERSFGTRRHADAVTFEFTRRGTRADDPDWEALRRAALASSAFPFAFPVRSLVRSRADYAGATLPPGGDDLTMWYLDGGLFDTAPLGLAKRLVERESGFRDDDWRYILVEPTLRSSQAEPTSTASAAHSLGELAADLSRAVLGQGAAQDWVRANRINARLEVLSALVDRLPELNDRLHDPDEVGLGLKIGELAERVAEMQVALDSRVAGRHAGSDPAGHYLDAQLERIETDERYSAVLAGTESRAGRSRLAKLVFLLEAAGGLAGKDIMKLYLVAPREAEALSGDFLGNFGGFLNRSWRENDFRAGRRDARRMLEESLGDVVSYDPVGEESYRVEALQPSWDTVPPAARNRLAAVLESEADRVLADLKPGGVAGIFSWAWRPVLKRLLVERAMRALKEAR